MRPIVVKASALTLPGSEARFLHLELDPGARGGQTAKFPLIQVSGQRRGQIGVRKDLAERNGAVILQDRLLVSVTSFSLSSS